MLIIIIIIIIIIMIVDNATSKKFTQLKTITTRCKEAREIR